MLLGPHPLQDGGVKITTFVLEITRVREVLRLVILDPQITLAILEGRQPRTLSLESLVRNSLPLDWESQRRIVAEIGA